VLKITQIKTETGRKMAGFITQHGQHNSHDPEFPVLCFQRPLQYSKVQDIQSLFDVSKHRGFAVYFFLALPNGNWQKETYCSFNIINKTTTINKIIILCLTNSK